MARLAALALLAAAAGAVDPGVGQYVANLVSINLPKQVVQGLLDDGLTLGDVPGLPPSAAGKHPVIFCFGQQREVHPAVHVGNFPFNWAYDEFIMSIPFVYKGAKGPFAFCPRLFLDNSTHLADAQEAVLAGWTYGLAKKLAHISTTPANPWGLQEHRYEITERPDASRRLLSLRAAAGTPWRKGSDFPKFQVIGSAMDNPIIGDTSPLGKTTGKYVCAEFHWHLDTARVASIDGQVTVHESFLSGLPTGTFNFTGVETTDFGAFRLSTNWSMAMPHIKCV
eukprot:TRINITY_DN21405_c0_g1_i1.p2 TRINITY_DN21405_c0_g1~~TRINITY_DN21405_c0_g1_i1.p2  ORF type:complete len:303 (+),score=132.80 TRINITY_DN21405_c0_g1_i1:68-910(+)